VSDEEPVCIPLQRDALPASTTRFLHGIQVNYFVEMCSGSEEGSYLRLIDFCIAQL